MSQIISYLLPIAIGIIMFGIGLNLSFNDFKKVFIAPKAVITGLIGQLLLLPAMGFIIASIFPIDPIFKLGIVLLAICPGGTSSNIVTYMLRGRVALSVSITAFNSFLIVLTIPFYLHWGIAFFINDISVTTISFGQTVIEVMYTVIAPVVLGMLVNHNRSTTQLAGLKKSLRYILPGILFLVFTLVLFLEGKDGELNMSDYLYLILPALLLNIGAMYLGWLISKTVGINRRGRYTIAIEMGLQNSALAIFLANNIINIDGLAVIAVLYGGFSFFSTWLVAYGMKRRGEKSSYYSE